MMKFLKRNKTEKEHEKKREKKRSIKSSLLQMLKYVIILVVLLLLVRVTAWSYVQKTAIDYLENLDAVAVVVDGEEMTLQDLGFYVLYQEYTVERMAEVYNDDNTRDFWNIHTNGYFISAQAKKAVMGMAVHDRIFYRLALEEGITLTTEEKELLETRRTDFWEDLYAEQKENLPGTYESINRTMFEIALAEKYQSMLAKEMDVTYHSLDWDAYDYEEIIYPEHTVKIKTTLWHRVYLGNITLVHGEANYINGLTDEEKEELQNRSD